MAEIKRIPLNHPFREFFIAMCHVAKRNVKTFYTDEDTLNSMIRVLETMSTVFHREATDNECATFSNLVSLCNAMAAHLSNRNSRDFTPDLRDSVSTLHIASYVAQEVLAILERTRHQMKDVLDALRGVKYNQHVNVDALLRAFNVSPALERTVSLTPQMLSRQLTEEMPPAPPASCADRPIKPPRTVDPIFNEDSCFTRAVILPDVKMPKVTTETREVPVRVLCRLPATDAVPQYDDLPLPHSE